MKILNRLTLKSLKLNKKRTRATIVGILLSSILVTAVLTLASSYQKTKIEHQKKVTGDWHYEFLNISPDKLKEIQQNKNTEKVFVTQDIGFTSLNFINTSNISKKYGYIIGFSKDALNNLGLNLIEGRFPENENEIVVQRQMSRQCADNWNVGDEITLKIGQRFLNGNQLNKDDFYMESEEFISKESKQYTIVGIIEHPNEFIENIQSQNYTIITQLENIQHKYVNAFVRYNNLNKINPSGNYSINQTLINLETNNLDEKNTQLLYILAGIVILIITMMSVFCIRNSFEISVIERIKDYGILSSIGATSKQIKYSILFEGFLLGIIAIPFGICVGIFLIYTIIQIVKIAMNNSFLWEIMIFHVNFAVVLLSVIINFITIYLICKKVAKKACKISPIEAIKSNKDINSNYKKIKSSIFIKKFFGVGGDIAYKNLKRNSKKYNVSINSIIISVILFIAMNSFVQYSLQSVDSDYIMDYNLIISNRNYETMKEISQNKNIQKYAINRSGRLYTSNTSYPIYAVGEQEYKNFIQELGLNYDETKNSLIFIVPTDATKKEFHDSLINFNNDLKTGDMLNGKINEESVNLPIISVTTKLPMGIGFVFESTGIVSEEFWKKHKFGISSFDNIEMYVDAENAYLLEDWILSNYSPSEISVFNQDEIVRNNKILWTSISVFLYILIGMITLISMTNIFNAITSNMQLRQKEFANLKSIGLTSKEFNKIINLESIFYGIKSLIIGIPIGIILSYVIYKIFNKKSELEYILPISTIFIVSILIFIFIWSIMEYSIKQINKQNIIETIRNDNI